MIKDTVTRRQQQAITSDRWHVIHAEWCGKDAGHPPFSRSIVSEHEDRAHARAAAKELSAALTANVLDRPSDQRDQFIVRKPHYKSLRFATRRA
jgi:hypothetical protein